MEKKKTKKVDLTEIILIMGVSCVILYTCGFCYVIEDVLHVLWGSVFLMVMVYILYVADKK